MVYRSRGETVKARIGLARSPFRDVVEQGASRWRRALLEGFEIATLGRV